MARVLTRVLAAWSLAAGLDVGTVEPGTSTQWIRHVVAPRERLEQIAARYRVDVAAILRWNELSDPAQVEKGDKLRIHTDRPLPQRRRVEVVVGEGDGWTSIARIHGVDPADLRAYNYRRGRTLVHGETLQVWADPVVADAIRTSAEPRAFGVDEGGVGIGPPQAGRLINAVRIPDDPRWVLLRPSSAWGTTFAVRSLVRALSAFAGGRSHPAAVVVAMSRPRGGPLGGHLSHQSGRDVDVLLVPRPGQPLRRHPRPSRVDWVATWNLVRALVDVGGARVLFLEYKLQRRLYRAAQVAGASQEELDRLLQYPRGSAASRGVVRHSPGHTGHVHVRFPCGTYEVECVESSLFDPP